MIKKHILLTFLILLVGFSILAQDSNVVSVKPRMRVIVDNDYSGDPDGLFMLAHMLLSPSVDIRAVVGSHLRAGDGFDDSRQQAVNAAAKAKELIEIMSIKKPITVLTGSNSCMMDSQTPVKSEVIDFVIQEANRTDTELPLYYVCGGGLTEIASVLVKEPSIADKLTVIWIGGPEHPTLASPPPGYSIPEYNTNIDLAAAQVIFNHSNVPFWQVPRNAYRQTILSFAELQLRVKPHGKTGAYLYQVIEELMIRIQPFLNIGETYIYGDNPLVLLTALQSSFELDPASSDYTLLPAPLLDEKGQYNYNATGRNIRVYDRLDVRLMFEDFFAKLELHAQNK